MNTLEEINEYYDRLNLRLIAFGEGQKIIEAERERFFSNVDKAYQKDKDHIAEGRTEQEKLENSDVRYED